MRAKLIPALPPYIMRYPSITVLAITFFFPSSRY